MSKSCKMSVIIPCFNHGEFLPEAVASVTRIRRDDVELIVVDDGSTDKRTRNEMDTLCAHGIKVIRQENKGLAAARNVGILASQGEYLFPLDADNRLRSGWIDRGIGILTRTKLASSTAMRNASGPVQTAGMSARLTPDRLLHWEFHPLFPPSTVVLSGNRTGGYYRAMPVQGLEDWDFWLGALEHGWRFAYVPEVFFDIGGPRNR